MSTGTLAALLDRLRIIAGSKLPPEAAALEATLSRTRACFDSEPQVLRPRDSLGRPGGLLILPDLPALILPDIHARPELLLSALAWKPFGLSRHGDPARKESTILDLLSEGRAILLALGDIFHSEGFGAKELWSAAFREYKTGWSVTRIMNEEMGRALSALSLLLEAKAAFPQAVHWLKGNHDNIANEDGRGDHSFYKYAAEGDMAKTWFEKSYGSDLLRSLRGLELSLPVLAKGRRFMASHAEPAFPLAPEDAIEYRSRPDVVEALIWTANGEARQGSVEESMRRFIPGGALGEGIRWFSGHRHVEGRYALRAQGRLVQFHNPLRLRGAWIRADRDPDPERDIVDLD